MWWLVTDQPVTAANNADDTLSKSRSLMSERRCEGEGLHTTLVTQSVGSSNRDRHTAAVHCSLYSDRYSIL